MKIQKLKTVFLLGFTLVFAGFTGGCDWIDPDLNVDPNNPSEVTENLLLTSAEVGLGYAVGSDVGRYSSLFTQHHRGTGRQHAGYYLNYSFTEGNTNNIWRWNLYGGAMMDMKTLIDMADESGSPHYAGVGRVLLAYSVLMCSDLWGDVPYSEAWQGAANLTPKYDSQQELYTTALPALLDQAIADLSQAESVTSPGADDLMLNGDLNKWIKIAWGIKARIAIHQSNVDENAAISGALSAIGNALSDNSDDMDMPFGSIEANGNPLYKFVVDRDDISMGPKLMEVMNLTNDPRRPMYAVGDTAGMYDENSALGPYFASIDSPVFLMTNAEMRFIEAEAYMRQGQVASATDAYTAGITASMAKLGVAQDDIDAYLAQEEVMPETGITLEHVMREKYVALYTQYESFTDVRRTMLPAITPTTGSKIPQRFPYPTSERLYNGANLPQVADIFVNMWWAP